MITETYNNDRESTSILAARYPSYDADGHWVLLSSYTEGPGKAQKRFPLAAHVKVTCGVQYNREIVF